MAEEEEGSPPEEGGGGGVPKWVVTFSDLMSLLLAFFVLLFAFSSQDDKKFKQMGGSLQEAFGVQRREVLDDSIMGVNHIAQEFSSSRPDNTIVNIIPQQQLLMAVRYLTKEPPVRKDTLNSQGDSEQDSDKNKAPTLEDAPESEAVKMTTIQMSAQEEQKALTDAESISVTQAEKETETGQDVAEGKSTQDAASEKQAQAEDSGGAKSEEQTAGGQQAANQAEDGRKASKYESAAARSVSDSEPDQENVFKHKGELADPSYEKLHSGARELRQKLAKEIEQGLIDVETNGDKLIIRIADETSFDPGSAELTEPAGPIMSPIADVLQQVRGKIIVQGHTDDIPLTNSKFSSNWDLSAGRAATVVRELMNVREIAKDRFRVEAYAETKPLVTNDTEWGRSRNRRVEIIVHQTPTDSQKKRIRNPLEPLPIEDPNKEAEEKAESTSQTNSGHDELDSLFEDFPNMFAEDEPESTDFLFNAGE